MATSRRMAMEFAVDIRKKMSKYSFNPEKNAGGYTVNATDEQFIQNGGGMCRDFVRQQVKILKRSEYIKGTRNTPEYESFMLVPMYDDAKWDCDLNMHAFTIVYGVDGSVYLPESTLDDLMGVWYFPSIKDCIIAIRTALKFDHDKRLRCYSYIGDDENLLGMNRAATVDYVMAHCMYDTVTSENYGPVYEGLRIGG